MKHSQKDRAPFKEMNTLSRSVGMPGTPAGIGVLMEVTGKGEETTREVMEGE
jgi:hypothetical protein